MSDLPIIFSPCSDIQDTSEDTITRISQIRRRGQLLADQLCFQKKSLGRDARFLWEKNLPICFSDLISNDIPKYETDIRESYARMRRVLESEDEDDILSDTDLERIESNGFELISSSFDEGDPQEIIKFDFDAVDSNGEVLAEDLWCKLSWLSYEDDDESLRFRFSFGFEGYEDVASDSIRQSAAAKLTDAIFPESKLIVENKSLKAILESILETSNLEFVERIVYFNAPNGGAQFHHDVERGHLGVVYAQVSGETFWLACSKKELMVKLQKFVKNSQVSISKELQSIILNESSLRESLNENQDQELEKLLNSNTQWFDFLIHEECGYILKTGDVLLLPQNDIENCCWHTVFCLGDKAGEGLSFAIKRQG